MGAFPVDETVLSLRSELEKILPVSLPRSLAELEYGYHLYQLSGQKENSVGFLLGLVLFCIDNGAFGEAQKYFNLLVVEVASCAPRLRLLAEALTQKLTFTENVFDTSFERITLQSQLLEHLKTGPKKRIQLIEALYGSAIDWSKSEKNFRQLLSRTKRRWPGIIIQSGDTISLVK